MVTRPPGPSQLLAALPSTDTRIVGPLRVTVNRAPGAGTKFTVTRSGHTLAMNVEGGATAGSGSCNGPEGRITLGLQGLGPETVTVKALAVRRR